MKDIKEYLNESLFDKDLIKKNNINYKPLSKQELNEAIAKYIEITNPKKNNTINLNWLNVSQITDFSYVFSSKDKPKYRQYNFDVSEWDVSNCKNFTGMFANCKKFNCNLSKWDVSNAKHMGSMFQGCIEFDGDGLNDWNISKNCFITGMFKNSGVTENNLPSWADEWTLK